MRKYSYELSTSERNFINKMKKDLPWICYYCNQEMKFYSDVRVDHKQPHSRGGLTNLENCVICCEPCNTDKKAKSEEEYYWFLEYKNQLRNFTIYELKNLQYHYIDLVRINHNMKENGRFIRHKCEAISKILKEKGDSQ